MKVRMNFGILKTIACVAVILGALAIVGLDISMLADREGISVTVPLVAGFSLSAAVLIAVIAILVLCNSYYKFKDKHYVAMVGFIADKVPYDDIICIKQNVITKEIYVLVAVENSAIGTKAYKINVTTQNVDAFLVGLREKKTDLVIEFFEPDKKDKTK